MNDLTPMLIEATGSVTVAAMQGNAGAGGVFLALAADQVWARRGVVLNPHYKNMGNLYGSEYWTYLLPRRLKSATVADVMGHRLPVSAGQAARAGPGRQRVRRRPGRVRCAQVRDARRGAGGRRRDCRGCCRPSNGSAGRRGAAAAGAPIATTNWRACSATSTASTRATTSRARTSCGGWRRRGRRGTWRCTGSGERVRRLPARALRRLADALLSTPAPRQPVMSGLESLDIERSVPHSPHEEFLMKFSYAIAAACRHRRPERPCLRRPGRRHHRQGKVQQMPHGHHHQERPVVGVDRREEQGQAGRARPRSSRCSRPAARTITTRSPPAMPT